MRLVPAAKQVTTPGQKREYSKIRVHSQIRVHLQVGQCAEIFTQIGASGHVANRILSAT